MEAEPGTVGYVGNLGDRVDWQLVVAVAKSLPAVRFDFAGRTDDVGQSGQRPDWLRWRSEAFQLPNVRRHPTVPQHQVGSYYWRTALNWIPYDVGHPFNVASCPTKIMDGLASGRPVLSTAVPECLLYPDHISVFRSAGEAKRLIEQSLQTVARGDWRNRQVAQLEFVRQHLWPKRAALLADWLQSLLGE
jgi:glycosyltransferase involved in cell wall biosynthesis